MLIRLSGVLWLLIVISIRLIFVILFLQHHLNMFNIDSRPVPPNILIRPQKVLRIRRFFLDLRLDLWPVSLAVILVIFIVNNLSFIIEVDFSLFFWRLGLSQFRGATRSAITVLPLGVCFNRGRRHEHYFVLLGVAIATAEAVDKQTDNNG